MTGVRYSDTVKYTCTMGYVHTGGDLERTCGRDRRWDGLSPFCTSKHINLPFHHNNYVPCRCAHHSVFSSIYILLNAQILSVIACRCSKFNTVCQKHCNSKIYFKPNIKLKM